MKNLSLLTIALVFIFSFTFPAYADLMSQKAEEFAPGVLVVKFAEGVKVKVQKKDGYIATGIPSTDVLNRKYGVGEWTKVFSPEPKSEKGKTTYAELGLGRIYKFEAVPQADVQAMVAEYAADPNVEYAEPDHFAFAQFIPNDPNFWRQWGLHNTGTNPPEHPGTVDADVDATEAWSWWSPEHVIVLAILDTGLDYDHPDFWWTYPATGVIWRNTSECAGLDGIDDDLNGYVDDCWGFDFINGTQSGGVWYNDADGPQDDHVYGGHGTHVAGIAGAIGNNGIGVAGMASGPFNVQLIMAVKVLSDSGSGPWSKIAAGVYYAANNNASVINMSLGGTSFSSTLQAAVNYAWGQGCVVVAAMGNCNSSTPMYPAAFTNTIAVGATDTDDSRCDSADWSWGWDPVCGSDHGSNYGPHIDVVAPGNWIYSTKLNNTYGYMSGTSMATPLVSGLAALIMSRSWPEPSPDSVRQIIQSTADDTVGLASEDTPGWDQYHGWGRINAAKALGVPTPMYVEDFNDCDISDWTVYTSLGTFATTTAQYVSPPCGLYMSSPQLPAYAYGRTPFLDLDTTKDFTITTYFRLPSISNHWFWVMNNNWVELVIDYNTQLRAWQGGNGGVLHLANLNTNQWYYIKVVVHPASSNYDVYLNGFLVGTANFLSNYLRYLRLGEFETGSANYGGGYWDDLMVYGQKSFLCGDVNGNGVVDLGDVVYLIAYLYKGGPPPIPLTSGDVNVDGVINIGDVVYLITYLYKGGPAPCQGKGGFAGNASENDNLGHAKISLVLKDNPANEKGRWKVSAEGLDEVSEISVKGKFDRDVAGVELEIEFSPDEITLLDPTLTHLTENLQIFFHTKDGTQKIGMVDLSGENLIPAGEGTLVNLWAKGVDLSSIKIKKAILVDENANELALELSSELKHPEALDSPLAKEDFQKSKPTDFSLSQNYPNPFNPQTSVRYALPQEAQVKLVVYNVLGEKVKILVDERQSAGYKTAWWDGKDEEGTPVASGIYFYRLEANPMDPKSDKFAEVKKMMLVR